MQQSEIDYDKSPIVESLSDRLLMLVAMDVNEKEQTLHPDIDLSSPTQTLSHGDGDNLFNGSVVSDCD